MSAAADLRWMDEALAEAERGLGHTAPNPAVGCVIVRRGREVGRGFHRRAGTAHAEVVALAAAGARARGATAYVTLEPCSHTGRTGPCADALIEAGVARVVVAQRDPNPLVCGRGLARLRRAGIAVTTGVQRKAATEIVRGYAARITNGSPWVELKLAASLDGRIAARGAVGGRISCPQSDRRVQRMRARADAILVGVGTVLADDPRLTCRLRGGRDPLRVVLDGSLRTPTKARVLAARGNCLFVHDRGATAARRRRIEGAGGELYASGGQGRAAWLRLLGELGRRGVCELLIEGGSEVAATALAARVVNRVTIFYNPRLIGGDGVPLVGALGVREPDGAPRFRTLALEASGEDWMWTGEPV